MEMGSKPRSSRPYMPGYGIQDASAGKGLLPWAWATERLIRARNYWVATTRPDGRPHAMPVWGVWLEDRFFFSSAVESRKARNLAENAYCVIGVEPADEAIILEGMAERVSDQALMRRFADAYAAKYEWDMSDFAEPVYAVRPVVVFAFNSGAGDFTGSATRWEFD